MTKKSVAVAVETKAPLHVRAAVTTNKVTRTVVGVAGASIIGAAIGVGKGLTDAVEANGGHVPAWLEALL
jgi:hypothetical protein